MKTLAAPAEQTELQSLLARTGADALLDQLATASPWSADHTRFTGEVTMAYGTEVGMSIPLRVGLGFAATMHDIGKAGEVYQPILASVHTPLTPSEALTMSRHTTDGADMIGKLFPSARHAGDAGMLRLAGLVCSFHHSSEGQIRERYDGPHGKHLRSVVALVKLIDHMDAATDPNRPHGKKMHPQMAVAEVLPRILAEGHRSIFGMSAVAASQRVAQIIATKRPQAA